MKPRNIHLTPAEVQYINMLRLNDLSFQLLLQAHPAINLDHDLVDLDQSHAELLRGYFTARLASVGFDSDYKPNLEGRMLETLIDKFFLQE